MTSSPASTRASIAKNMMGLAPGVTTTRSAATSKPLRAVASAAIASRSAGRPSGGP
jgi:hypothetical protein